jgi:hypothetical protein
MITREDIAKTLFIARIGNDSVWMAKKMAEEWEWYPKRLDTLLWRQADAVLKLIEEQGR